MISSAFDWVQARVVGSLEHQALVQAAAASVISLWVIWRLWKFSFHPVFHPKEPLEFPHFFPYLGHAITFFKDSHGTITRARDYFSNSRKPFGLTLAGQKLYVLTNPNDITVAYKENTALTFDNFIITMMHSFGTTPRAIDQMWWEAGHGVNQFEALTPNPSNKCLAQLTRDLHKLQWHPGPQLDVIGAKFIAIIRGSLQWKHITDSEYAFEVGENSYHASLTGWAGTVLLEAATRAFFGDALLRLRPNIFKSFFDFDEQSWMLMYRYPRPLSRYMHQCKDDAIDGLSEYFALPYDQRSDCSWFVKTLEAEQRKLGMSDKDIASLLLQVYWVINSNTWKLCFWVLAHLLWQPELMTRIREETSPAFKSSSSELDMTFLEDSCPLLNSIFDETLRLTNSSSSVRTVASDVELGGQLLRAGRTVLMPYRQLHFDPAVFGPDVNEFQPERFLQNPKLRRSPSYRPFGGGTTYCPGRFIARQEVLAFMSLALREFTLSLASEDQAFPAIEEMKPCLGVMGPVHGQDITVLITPRQF